MADSNKFLIIVCGPTASGKTGIAVQLALHYGTEILSTDSRQLFKELNIGTAKPSVKQLSAVKHHFIDHISIVEDYNAGRFEAESIMLLDKLFQNKNIVFAAGGTGLYIDALVNGLDDIPHASPETRDALTSEFQTNGLEHLQKLALEADPTAYAKTDISNPQRLMRIVEVYRATGKPISGFRKNKSKQRNFQSIKLGLEVDREVLYKRIDDRVEEMMKAGLLDEVRGLVSNRNRNSLQTVGYQELFEYLDGRMTLDRAVDLIKRNSRRYAKRQMTWFRRDKDIQWFAPGEVDDMISYIDNQILLKSKSTEK